MFVRISVNLLRRSLVRYYAINRFTIWILQDFLRGLYILFRNIILSVDFMEDSLFLGVFQRDNADKTIIGWTE